MSHYTLQKTVVMVGMMGAGKTAVGARLAQMLRAGFIDSDDAIEAAANATIAEIFANEGEAFFRRKESQVLARLLDGPPAVLSTGGGAYLSAANRRLIAARGIAVWLKADLDLLWSRVRRKDTRPLLRVADPQATLRALLAEREPAYREAGLVVEANADYSVQDMAGEVLKALIAHDPAAVREVA